MTTPTFLKLTESQKSTDYVLRHNLTSPWQLISSQILYTQNPQSFNSVSPRIPFSKKGSQNPITHTFIDDAVAKVCSLVPSPCGRRESALLSSIWPRNKAKRYAALIIKSYTKLVMELTIIHSLLNLTYWQRTN